MEWQKLSREKKIQWLEQQLEEIHIAVASIMSFEHFTRKMLKRLRTQKSK